MKIHAIGNGMVIDVSLESRQKYLHYALIFWMIQLINSNFVAFVGIDMMYILTWGIALFVLIIYKDRILLYRSHTLWFMLLVALAMFGYISTDGLLTAGTILNVLGKILFVYVVIAFDSEKFLERFLRLAYVLSICSLICWGAYVLLGSGFVNLVCKLLIPVDGNQYGIFLIGYNLSQTGIEGFRNTYMYAEPGVHQMIPNTALILLMFFGKRLNLNVVRYMVVFIVNIITIQSTEGYMILIATLLIGMFQFDSGNNKQIVKLKYIIVLVIIIAFVYMKWFFTEDSFLYSNFFAKIFNESNQLDFSAGTSGARYDSVIRFMNFFKTNISTILFGCGSTAGTLATSFVSINGIFILTAYFGILFSVAFYAFGIFQLFKNSTFFYFLAAMFAVICHGISQPDFMNVLCLVMLLYGSIYNLDNHNKEYEDELA